MKDLGSDSEESPVKKQKSNGTNGTRGANSAKKSTIKLETPAEDMETSFDRAAEDEDAETVLVEPGDEVEEELLA